MKFIFTFLLLSPAVAAAQTDTIQGFLITLISFIDAVLIPFLLGLAFLFFVWNAVRFFIIGGANETGQENAKNLALYSILAFVFILSFWGLVNLVADGVGLTDCTTPMSDYELRHFVGPMPAGC